MQRSADGSEGNGIKIISPAAMGSMRGAPFHLIGRREGSRSLVRHAAALGEVESNLVYEDFILLGQAAVLPETRLDHLQTFKLAPARRERRAEKQPAWRLKSEPVCLLF